MFNRRSPMLAALWAIVFAAPIFSAELVEQTPSSAASFNIKTREFWTTGKIHGSPDPADPYTTKDAFPQLKFMEPLSLGLVPDTDRFGVATRPGKIFTFQNSPETASADLLLDIQRTTYGVAFHPQFAQNGYFFVTSVLDPKLFLPQGSRLSRFCLKPNSGLVADLSSELVVLEWPSGGHNGGCIRFGPDGYLYLSTGDGSGIADELKTGQDISDLLGSMLRIDIDHPEGGRNYSIPKDNPFEGQSDARGEIWSFGHRQVWKFSFDDQQRLWAGEVGQDLWETISLIQRGGNYGWSVLEGRQPFRPQRPQGPAAFVAPVVEHSHIDSRSITGGYVSQTDRLPDLKGAYIYGDYDTGKVWSFKFFDGKAIEHRQLADTQIRIVEFAQDRSGEVYLVDFVGGGLHRIVEAAPQIAAQPFPRKLSQTGLFSSTKDHLPARGLIPYSVNAPLWSDGAEKDRFIALPGNSQIEFDSVIYPHGADYPDVGWRFPDGTVLVKTFSLSTDARRPEHRQRLETRLLQYRQMPGNDDEYGAQFWNGYTYVWNEAQTDADLLPADGLDKTLIIQDALAPQGQREQTWRFPSRAECALCHTMASKYILGVSTLQMNKDHNYGGVVANQLTVLDQLGVFKNKLPKPVADLPRLVDYRETHESLHLRARAYLHANCAHCHRKWGGGKAEFELHASIPLSQTLTVNTRPGQGTFQMDDPRIVVLGVPDRSMILHRMKLEGLGRMPHIASKVIDTDAVEMISRWIASLSDPAGAINPRLPPH